MRSLNRYILRLVLINLSLLASTCSFAQTDWSGSVDLKAISYTNPVSSIVNDQLYQADIKLGAVRQFQNMSFTGKMEYVGDPSNKSIEEQSYFDLPEFNFKGRLQSILLKVGTDIYTWGVTDGFNPLDLVNTRNYFDPFHSKKMGTPSVSLNYAEGWFEADLIYIPWARPSMLPGVNSRWLPRQIYYSYGATGPGVELLLPNQVTYSYLPRGSFGQPLQNNAAVRLQAHLDTFELALYGYSGVASVPIIIPNVNINLTNWYPNLIVGQVTSGIQLKLQDYSQQVGGASITKTIGSWQLKAAGSWTQADSQASAYQNWS